MTLLVDIATYLTKLGLVEGDGIDVYRDFQPETPDNIVSLHEYQGSPVSPHMESAHRSVQVLVRNKSAEVAHGKAFKLYKAFLPQDDSMRIDFTDTRWGQVFIRQSPHKITQDANDRTIFGFNLGITTVVKEEE